METATVFPKTIMKINNLSVSTVSTETVFDLVHTFGLTLRFHKVYRVCVFTPMQTLKQR